MIEAPQQFDTHVRDYHASRVQALRPHDYSDEAIEIIRGYSDFVPEPDARPERDWGALDLEEAWGIQTARLLELGFDKIRGFETPGAYLATLPKFSPKPPDSEGRFYIPVLIDPRVSLRQLTELAEVNFHRSVDVRDWRGSGFQTPHEPYAIWAGVKDIDYEDPLPEKLANAETTPELQQEIAEFLNEQRYATTIPVVRKRLRQDERGAVAMEGVFYYLYNPEIFKTDLIGRNAKILMVGSESLDPRVSEHQERELRLFLGIHTNAEVCLANNGDSAIGHTDPSSRALVVAR